MLTSILTRVSPLFAHLPPNMLAPDPTAVLLARAGLFPTVLSSLAPLRAPQTRPSSRLDDDRLGVLLQRPRLGGSSNGRAKVFNMAILGAAFRPPGGRQPPTLRWACPRRKMGRGTQACHRPALWVPTPGPPSFPQCAATARRLLRANASTPPVPPAHPAGGPVAHLSLGSMELDRAGGGEVHQGWPQASVLPASVPPCPCVRPGPLPPRLCAPACHPARLRRSLLPTPTRRRCPASLPGSSWHRALSRTVPSGPSVYTPVTCCLSARNVGSVRAARFPVGGDRATVTWRMEAGKFALQPSSPKGSSLPETRSPRPWRFRSLTPSSCQAANW